MVLNLIQADFLCILSNTGQEVWMPKIFSWSSTNVFLFYTFLIICLFYWRYSRHWMNVTVYIWPQLETNPMPSSLDPIISMIWRCIKRLCLWCNCTFRIHHFSRKDNWKKYTTKIRLAIIRTFIVISFRICCNSCQFICFHFLHHQKRGNWNSSMIEYICFLPLSKNRAVNFDCKIKKVLNVGFFL